MMYALDLFNCGEYEWGTKFIGNLTQSCEGRNKDKVK